MSGKSIIGGPGWQEYVDEGWEAYSYSSSEEYALLLKSGDEILLKIPMFKK